MSFAAIRRLTPSEYLERERASDSKHEFLDGYLVAMAGGSGNHGLIAGRVITALNNALADRGCRVYTSDVRVSTQSQREYFYPDVTIACDQPEWQDRHHDTLLNPLVVVEVLSPSTEAYDRGVKFAKYRTIPSLKVFVLISQDQPFVEVHERKDFNRWETTYAESIDATIELPVVKVSLKLHELYKLVEFPPPADRPRPFDDLMPRDPGAPLT
jgi:Uma2 family endonuclease